MRRRTVLKISLFSLAALIPSLLHQRGSQTTSSAFNKTFERHLLSVFSNVESAKIIGKTYLSSLPDSLNRDALLSELCLGCDGGVSALSDMNTQALKEWLDRRQRNDFAEGRTVRVNGWILSKTEVDICALAALS
ncbi:MAG: hypothetical protein VKK04_14865 [Synechococcales bacterium]|nr:hypothetical protein [Synechococcales bacterium]